MDGKNETLNDENELQRVRLWAQVSHVDGLLDGANQLRLPRADHAHQLVADGAGTIVILDGAGYIDAPARDFDADAIDPATVHRLEPRQAARFVQTREEDILHEPFFVFLEYPDLQVLARTEGREATA